MRIKEIIKTVLFLAILVAVTLAIQPFFIPYTSQDTRQAITYYDKQDLSEDILIVGPSSTFVGLSPLRMYEKNGLTAYNLGNSVQFPMIGYLNVKEALDRGMKPRLVIFNSKSITLSSSVDDNEPFLRRGMDYKKLSVTKMEAIREIVRLSEWQDVLSYVVPLLRYHSRWPEMTLNKDYATTGRGLEYDYRHGQWPVYKVKILEDVRDENMSKTEKAELMEDYVKWFRKTAELCNDNGIPVLLVVMPDLRWTTGKHDTLQELADSMGDKVDFFDFNYNDGIDKAGLDLKTDFYDDHHVNARGSLKTTDYIMNYIVDKYDMHESQSTEFLKKQNEWDRQIFKTALSRREYIKVEDTEEEE